MKTPLFIKILQDTAGDSTRKRIERDELSQYCRELAHMVQRTYEPYIIISIATGGILPGQLIAEELQLPLEEMTIRRDIHIGRMYNRDPMPLRWIMSLYHHFLFHTTAPTISQGIDIDLTNKKILLVDDSLHTGSTLDTASRYLTGMAVSEIRIATIAYTSTRKPDFHILPRGNYCFPWSKDF